MFKLDSFFKTTYKLFKNSSVHLQPYPLMLYSPSLIVNAFSCQLPVDVGQRPISYISCYCCVVFWFCIFSKLPWYSLRTVLGCFDKCSFHAQQSIIGAYTSTLILSRGQFKGKDCDWVDWWHNSCRNEIERKL